MDPSLSVGVTFFFELTNRSGHFRDVLGGAGDALGPLEAKGVAVGKERLRCRSRCSPQGTYPVRRRYE